MKTVFTTGEAAKICKVSQQTIIRCFDSGQLKGFRVPGSRFRRIPREQLYTFMRDNGIPTDALESGKRKVLIVDDDEELVELITDALERDGRFEVRSVNNGFDAGMMVKEYRPDLIVLDVMLPDINGKEVCQRVRSDKTMDDVRIICISGMVEEDKVERVEGGRGRRLHAQAVRGRAARRADVPASGHRSGRQRLTPDAAEMPACLTSHWAASGCRTVMEGSPSIADKLARLAELEAISSERWRPRSSRRWPSSPPGPATKSTIR